MHRVDPVFVSLASLVILVVAAGCGLEVSVSVPEADTPTPTVPTPTPDTGIEWIRGVPCEELKAAYEDNNMLGHGMAVVVIHNLYNVRGREPYISNEDVDTRLKECYGVD